MRPDKHQPGLVRLRILHQMDVPVNQTREHGGAAQVDHLGALRDLHAIRRADLRNAAVFDENDLVG